MDGSPKENDRQLILRGPELGNTNLARLGTHTSDLAVMPVIFTLRLLPSPPTDPKDFLENYLPGLKIKAFDRSVADPSQEFELGTATGGPAVPGQILNATQSPGASLQPSIFQHFEGTNFNASRSVATAVIVVKDDAITAQRPDFPDTKSFDVRLEVTRGNVKIRNDPIEFNIAARNVQLLSQDTVDYMGRVGTSPPTPEYQGLPTGGYVFIPGPFPGGNNDPGPVISLDPNGAPPEFDELVKNIDAVLAKDHPPPAAATSLTALTDPLTAPQASEIASELVFNRKIFPLPTPKDKLEDLYTGPLKSEVDGQRAQFEGAVTSYYAKNNADAEKLKRFVYIASAAVLAEKQSFRAAQATLTLPIDPSMAAAQSASSLPITLTMPAATPRASLKPSFAVPAAYFYALGIHFSVEQKPEKLYDRALSATADFLANSLQIAIDTGAIKKDPHSSVSNEVTPKVTANLAQAIRRLSSLSGSFTTKPKYKVLLQDSLGGTLAGDVAALVTRWLEQTVIDAQLLSTFWQNEYPGKDYLEVILQVISDSKPGLENGIKNFPDTGITINRASDLLEIKDQQWLTFFTTNPSLLPDFTKPGNTEDRAIAYVQFLRTLFAIGFLPPPPIAPVAGTTPSFREYDIDMLWKFLSRLQNFDIENLPDETTIDAALAKAFPNDSRAQSWAKAALQTLHELYLVTKPVISVTPDPFQFSCIEALFVRGFTSAKSILALSSENFQVALQGTVAWASATHIYDAASEIGPMRPTEEEPNIGFKPVNPGDLVNCIPPEHLSPFGPVAYLHEALKEESGGITLQDAIQVRRGDISQLLVTKRNSEIELPQLDLVNESLEYLGSNLGTVHGVLQDTAEVEGLTVDDGLEQALMATPQWSTPAVPVANSKVYDNLVDCFTDPTLPYSQGADVSRSYLKMLGSNRFETMRRFRLDITELAMDPVHEPADFQRSLWRYPFRFDIALEYIQLSKTEYERLFAGDLTQEDIAQLYGYDPKSSWLDEIKKLPGFLKSTGLEYCDFYELWRTQFEPLSISPPYDVLPSCPPCCGEKIVLSTPNDEAEQWWPPWGRIIVFVRLWKHLNQICKDISFQTLSDICNVLYMFDPATHKVNPDFIRQMVSLLILRDDLGLPWTDQPDASTSDRNEKRTKLLAIWAGPQNAPAEWGWAVTTLLSRIQAHAEHRYHCLRRPPGFVKILSDNLDSLARLAGFTDDFPWYLNPSSTLRFTEVLTKVFASEFTVGEIIFLFTTQEHLRGDDPYPFTEESEAQDDPLNAPEDDMHGLWDLRRKLLQVEVSEEDISSWNWMRIQYACKELGFAASSTPSTANALTFLGTHFFPSAMGSSGYNPNSSTRRFSTSLAPNLTTPELWTGTHCEAFHYAQDADDPGSGELWVQLPLSDYAVFQQLFKSRQLNSSEANAVRNAYFAPRAALAPFALIFSNFGRAVEWLIHESSEEARWRYFQKEFATFYRRCEVIAAHLAEQIDVLPRWAHITKDCGCGCGGNASNVKAAWRILRTIVADENLAAGPWENDSGNPPESFTWVSFSGSAFAALVGLTGTGLRGRITAKYGAQEWNELRGGMDAFGNVRNIWNSPIPTFIPSLQLGTSPEQQDFVALRNGYALEDDHATAVGGASPFMASWTGSLLVEGTGEYTFNAGHPEDCCDLPLTHLEEGQKWLITLQRGQKTWTILNRCWKGAQPAPGHHSRPLSLTKGTYQIEIKFDQGEPTFTKELSVHQFHTGFQVQYSGPDTNHNRCVLPYHRLFQESKDTPLGGGLDIGGPIAQWLNKQFYSSFRDIRRTYQRAFKAVLFARRFHLSAHEDRCNGQSELGYMLDHGDRFMGTSYYSSGPGAWKTHHAFLNFNFLSVTDSYFPPTPDVDARVNPSPQRKAAVFDWWERLFDYTRLRSHVAGLKRHKRKKKFVWELFYEADTQKPVDAHQLIRHFDAEMSLATQVLTFLVPPTQLYEVRAADLLDERWATRVAKTVSWLQGVKNNFSAEKYEILSPALSASEDPNQEIDDRSGNESLVEFAVTACQGDHDRISVLQCVNDGLRERGRMALLVYLCGMERVQLDFGTTSTTDPVFATSPQDLSDLLLQDVLVGIRQRASRIEDAIQAVQTYVQRAKIGLEPQFLVDRQFSELWSCRFSSFQTWRAWKRRTLYRESWIHWDDVRRLDTSEGYSYYKKELQKGIVSFTNPGRRMWWTGAEWPDSPAVEGITAEQNVVLGIQREAMVEGLPLMATPDRHGRSTLIAPQNNAAIVSPEDTLVKKQSQAGDHDHLASSISRGTDDGSGSTKSDTIGRSTAVIIQEAPALFDELLAPPLWLQAAIRMGTRFVRLAASGLPSGFPYDGPVVGENQKAPCCKCDENHPPSIDEYYFWLSDGSFFSDKDAVQKASNDISISDQTDPTSEWDDPEKLPLLLHWKKQSMIHLFWTRLHRGVLDPPRRSDSGLELRSPDGKDDGVSSIFLSFTGRNVDSLNFAATAFSDVGFRYDLPTDSAVLVPQVVPDIAPEPHPLSKFLSSYPYFLYFDPGKTLEPFDSRVIALEMARHLRDDCKFEAASLWCRKAFDSLNRDNSWMRCPQDTLAKVSAAEKSSDSETERILTPPSSSAKELADPIIELPVSDPQDKTCCPTSPMGDGVSRARAYNLEYLSILLQWTDKLIKDNSAESFRQATVIADTIQRILGPTPTRIESQNPESAFLYTVQNFKALPGPLNPKLLQLYDEVINRKALIHDSLSSCRLRNGTPKKDLATWGANARYTQGPALNVRMTDDLCSDEVSCFLTRCQPYRFTALFPKAVEWAGVVKQLGASLLAAFEKGDSEYLATLRASHEHHILGLGSEVAQNNFRAADWEYQGLGKALAGAQTRARYYKNLIDKGINALELAYQQGMETAMMNRVAGNVEETIGQGLNMIPDFFVGFPAALSHLPLGTKLGYFFSAAARIQNSIADINSTQAGLSETQAGWLRRAEEWQHQLNVTEIEIEQLKRQQLASSRRRQVALVEVNTHQRQVEHSDEVLNFMRDRTTKHELYTFLQQETSVLYRQAFRLALQNAKEAQAALLYELGDFSGPRDGQLDFSLSENDLWNSLHEGLMAGEKLELALHSLERKYMTSNCREYEIVKHISLRHFAPMAFLLLKTGEECDVEIPEWWYDLDYPGHYMRRLKQVSLSLPCVAGPFTGVHCRLQLLSSAIRVRPLLPPAPKCCCASKGGALLSPNPSLDQGKLRTADSPRKGRSQEPRSPQMTKVKNNEDPAKGKTPSKKEHSTRSKKKGACLRCNCGPDPKSLPQDPYVVHSHHTSSSHMAIATSTGNADSGLFDPSLEQGRYLPFEFAGAASKWRITLPAQNNAFSLDTLSDVVLHLTYTSREGGQELKQATEAATSARTAGDGLRFIDLKHDMAEAWHGAFGSQAFYGDCDPCTELKLAFTKNMFPYTPGGQYRDIWVTKIQIFMEVIEGSVLEGSDDQCCGAQQAPVTHFDITYNPPTPSISVARPSNGRYPHASNHNPGPFPPTSQQTSRHQNPSGKPRKSLHYNDASSSPGSDTDSNASDSSCPCADTPTSSDPASSSYGASGGCDPDLRVKFPMIASPLCKPAQSDDSAPTTYIGTFKPVRPLGPIKSERAARGGKAELVCKDENVLGNLVFDEGFGDMEREVEGMYLLVEWELGGNSVRGRRVIREKGENDWKAPGGREWEKWSKRRGGCCD